MRISEKIFLNAVLTLSDFRHVKSLDDLYKFHSRHNYLFISCSQTLMHEMREVAANIKKVKTSDILATIIICSFAYLKLHNNDLSPEIITSREYFVDGKKIDDSIQALR